MDISYLPSLSAMGGFSFLDIITVSEEMPRKLLWEHIEIKTEDSSLLPGIRTGPERPSKKRNVGLK